MGVSTHVHGSRISSRNGERGSRYDGERKREGEGIDQCIPTRIIVHMRVNATHTQFPPSGIILRGYF